MQTLRPATVNPRLSAARANELTRHMAAESAPERRYSLSKWDYLMGGATISWVLVGAVHLMS